MKTYFIKRKLTSKNKWKKGYPGTVHILNWFIPFTEYEQFLKYVVNVDRSLILYFKNLANSINHNSINDSFAYEMEWRLK